MGAVKAELAPCRLRRKVAGGAEERAGTRANSPSGSRGEVRHEESLARGRAVGSQAGMCCGASEGVCGKGKPFFSV